MTWNPYEELGIKPDASHPTIRRAYRARAKETHPDAEGGSEEAFANVQLAYAILMDAASRAKFDTTGEAEAPKADQSRSGAIGLILEGLGSIMNEFIASSFSPHLDPARRDVLAILTTKIKAEIRSTKAEIATGEKANAAIVKMMERFKRKNGTGEDPIVAGLLAHIARNKERLKRLADGLKMREFAIEMLADYDYIRDEMAARINGNTSSTTTTVFTTMTR